MNNSANRTFWLIAFGLLFLSLLLRISFTLNRLFDPDEFQHLHASWMVAQGFFPYRDFWENHTPMLYYFLAPLLHLFEEGTVVLLICRAILSAMGLVIVWLTYRLTRVDHDRETSVLAAILVSYCVLFMRRSIEVRPDQFLVTCWLAALLVTIRQKRVLIAGLLMGVGMLFSPKALFCFGAFGLFFFSEYVYDRSFRLALRHQMFFTFGFLIPVAVCALFFHQNQALEPLIRSTLAENFVYPERTYPIYLLSWANLAPFILGFSGMIFVFLRRGEKPSRTESLLATPCLFLIAVLIFWMPAPFPQSALPFLPLLAFYGAIALKKSLDLIFFSNARKSPMTLLFVGFTLLTGILIPLRAVLRDGPLKISNVDQLSLVRFVVNMTDDNERIFDGNSIYVFRPQAYYYGSLVKGVQVGIRSGEITKNIPQSLSENHCKVVISDGRILDLPKEVLEFLRANYVLTVQPPVYVAGKKIIPSERLTKFSIQIPAIYSIRSKNGNSFLIDNRPYTTPVLLKEGIHTIEFSGPPQELTIRANLR